jgi:translocation and assembly module TamB
MAIVRRMGITAAILLASLAILVAAALALLNTNAAHRYVLNLIMKEVQDATGERVEIDSFSFHRGRPGADFYSVTVHGPASNSGTPLFSADRVGIDIGFNLLHAPKIAVQDVTLDHPVVHVFVDSQGNSNLPHANSSASGSSTNVFDMAIGHFIVNRGEIFYNDRRLPVTADLRDLNARAAYEDLTRSYDARLSYREGQVRYDRFAPFTHNLEVSFEARASSVVLKSLVLETAGSSIRARGTLSDHESPSFEGSYQASLSTSELANLARKATNHSDQTIVGRIDTKGTLTYRSTPGRAAFNNLSMAGTLSGRTLHFDSSRFRASVQNLTADYGLKQGVLEARKLDADALGGHVTAHLAISQLAGKAAARFEAAVQGVVIAAVRDALHAQELPGIRMDGRIDGDLQATWRGSVQDLHLVSNGRLAGTVSSASAAVNRSSSFPFSGAAQVSYDGAAQVVTLHNALVSTRHSNLALEGSLGNEANVEVEARSEDLHEVDLLAHLFQTSTSTSENGTPTAPQLLNLGGAAAFQGMVKGTLANPHVIGMFTATNLRVHNASVQSVKTRIEASPQGLAVHDGEVRNGPQTRASFDISVGLRGWNFTPEQPVAIRLKAEKVSLADLEHMAGFPYPISGVLATTMTVTGTEENPDIRGSIQLAQAVLWQQPVQNLNVELQNTGSRILAKVNLQSPAGSATATAAYDPKSREYDLQADLPVVRLNQIRYLQLHAPQASGIVNVSARGHGSTESPQLDLTVDGQQLQFGEQKVDGFKAQASVARQKADFNVEGNVSGATMRTRGTLNLAGGYEISANIDSQVILLDPLLRTLLPQAGTDLHGQTEFHGTVMGPLRDFNQLQGHLEIPSFQIGYPSIQLAATGPIHADYQGGTINVARAELKGTGTDVTLQASIPLREPAEMRATANGRVDLQLLHIWNPRWKSSGEVNLQVGIQGTRGHPEVSGTVAIADAALSVENLPTLEKVKGELNVTSEGVQVKSLTGEMGGGAFEVHGSAAYQPGVRYNLGMTTKNVRLLYPDGVRTQLTADLTFTGEPSNSYLAGEVAVDRLSLTQSFDFASLANEFGGPAQTTAGFAQNVKLNVALSSRQELEVASSQLTIQGSVDLRVRGTLAEPVLIGRTNLTGGEFFFNGRRFTVQNASIEFANPVRTNPVVNVTATTIVNQFNLTINLVGPFDRLRTTYTSDPPLAPVDVINLLITGQTTEASQGTTSTPESVIAGQLSGKVSDRLQKLTGISSLTIDPQIGGNQGNGASQLAIQERVTKNLFFTFATDVTTTQGEVVQVEYQFSRKYSMSAIRDQTGGYEVEIKSHKSF